MARKPVKLVWRATQVVRAVQTNLEEAYTEFGLTVERHSKKELKRGHGVLTGTLRRSIHLAEPGYNWSADDVPAGQSGPERGRRDVRAKTIGVKTTLLVGSGLRYALAVHQRLKPHGAFTGYHYLSNGLTKAKTELQAILKKHRMKK
jgi:hypothetical protein